MKEELQKLRDNLYNALPTGEIHAFELITLIKEHISDLDTLIEKQLPAFPELTKCCNGVAVAVVGDEGTGCYCCSKCGKPTDIIPLDVTETKLPSAEQVQEKVNSIINLTSGDIDLSIWKNVIHWYEKIAHKLLKDRDEEAKTWKGLFESSQGYIREYPQQMIEFAQEMVNKVIAKNNEMNPKGQMVSSATISKDDLETFQRNRTE